jgi:MFS transporter, PAT family, beta-lactamase induction signal transducer AmpG
MTGRTTPDRSPWLFVPTQAFLQGIPQVMVMTVSAILLKSLGASNDVIGASSLMMLPLSLLFLWGPVVDGISTKRRWILWMGCVMAGLMVVCGLALNYFPHPVVPVILLLGLMGLATGWNDVPNNGFYLLALDAKQQAFFTGFRTASVRLAVILCTGVLVALAGRWGEAETPAAGWASAFYLLAAITILLTAYHAAALPRPDADRPQHVEKGGWRSYYMEALRAFFRLPGAWVVMAFALTYRLGESLLVRMIAPFLMDTPEAGGLGLSTQQLGVMYGTFGTIASTLGGIAGGILLSRVPLRRVMLPFGVLMSGSNVAYVLLAWLQPSGLQTLHLSLFGADITWDINGWAQAAIIFESFCYGFGSAAFFYYLCIYSAQSEHAASTFALAMAFMGLGWSIPAVFSGLLQQAVGYTWLFILTIPASLPGLLAILYLKYPDTSENR